MVQQALVDLKYDLGEFGPNKDGVDGKYRSKTSSAVKQFKVDQNLGAQSTGSTERGVIYRLDELFPPAASP
jgi:peptidoglycan hydrolase-like protein with peptidoglycan-binding domain